MPSMVGNTARPRWCGGNWWTGAGQGPTWEDGLSLVTWPVTGIVTRIN